MDQVVLNTHRKPSSSTGVIEKYLTSRSTDGHVRPIAFNPQLITESQLKVLKSMGKIIDKPDGLETNEWPQLGAMR